MNERLREMALTLMAVVLSATMASAAWLPSDSEIDPELLRIDEQSVLGKRIDAGVALVDQNGEEFSFSSLRGEPVVLIMSYYTCDGFCPSFNTSLKTILEAVEELGRVRAGDDFKVVTLSFDKKDDSETAGYFLDGLGLTPGTLKENWRVGVFKDKADIKMFTEFLGYKYFWSPSDRMFFHPNAIYFMSPEGRVTRILHKAVSEPLDMQLAILDAKFSILKPSEVVNFAVSLCYSYNYKDGKYGLNYPLFIAFGSLFTGIGAFAVAATVTKRKSKKKYEARG